MRVFKWTPYLKVESSIVPVWMGPLNLSLFMFDKQCLFSIDQLIGTPLSIYAATADLSWHSAAKVCVQVDLLKKLPNRVGLACGEVIQGYWQEIQFDKLTHYCKHCRSMGHDINACKIANPSLVVSTKPKITSSEIPKPVVAVGYVEKGKEKRALKRSSQMIRRILIQSLC